MIMVLGGTTEGREITALLQQQAYKVSAAVLSDYGAALLTLEDESELLTGPLDRENFLQYLMKRDISAVVDATHPFAQQISQLAMQVTAELGTPYIRLERPEMLLSPHSLIKRIDGLAQLEAYFRPGQTVFSTLGSNHLERLLDMVQRQAARLVVRVLPRADILSKCETLGLHPEQIIALKGPFSKELNRQLYLHYGASLILSKDSGVAGGLDSKMQAALELGIPMVIWNRPRLKYPRQVYSYQEVLDYLQELQEV